MDIPFSPDDEALLKQVRDKLLYPHTVAESPLTPEQLTQKRRQRRLLGFLGVLCLGLAVLVIFSHDDSIHAKGPSRWVSVVLLALLGGRLLAYAAGLFASRKTKRQPADAVAPPMKPATRNPWLATVWLIVSLGLFIALFALVFSPLQIACLVGVLLFHEAGHFVGMKWFGYCDVQMFFIPGFGAAVRGVKKDVPAWQEGIVLLLGPLPGLVLGCALFIADQFSPSAILQTPAQWLVTINFFNLLPLGFLDGGRLCDRLLFQRSHLLEAAASAVGMVGMVFLCFGPGWICLTLSALFGLFVLAPLRYRTARAAAVVQALWPALPVEFAELTEEQWRDLFGAVRMQFGSKELVSGMKLVHERALRQPASGQAVNWLLAVYLSAFALTLTTAATTQLGEAAGRWPMRLKLPLNDKTQDPAVPAE